MNSEHIKLPNRRCDKKHFQNVVKMKSTRYTEPDYQFTNKAKNVIKFKNMQRILHVEYDSFPNYVKNS